MQESRTDGLGWESDLAAHVNTILPLFSIFVSWFLVLSLDGFEMRSESWVLFPLLMIYPS